MSDSDILDVLNATIEAQDRLAAEYDHTLIEIPPGRRQIRFHEGSEQWVPRGDVLRCHIEEDEAGDVVVYVDDQELSLHEFGKAPRHRRGDPGRPPAADDAAATANPEGAPCGGRVSGWCFLWTAAIEEAVGGRDLTQPRRLLQP